ncbi:MAG: ATP-binding protein [Aquabacterium sp.]
MSDPAPADLPRLRLLGDPAVLLPAGGAVPLERRAAALLALAVLEPGLSRQRAATMLWPDSDDPRRNLRQQLLRFRQTFGHALIDGAQTLALMPDLRHDIDGDGPDSLLGPLDYADCEAFETWLAAQRHARRASLAAALRQRLTRAEAAADLDQARTAAEGLVAVDPGNEAHHRELMRVLYLRGEADQALAQFAQLQQMLSRDLDAQPDAQTLALVRLVRQAQAAASVPSGLAPMPTALQRPPSLAGRDAELQGLLGQLQQRATVLLVGEAGMGKTRLMDAARQGLPGTAVLAVAARPGDRGVPYALATRWLRELAARDAQPPDARTRSALALLLPEWGDAAVPRPTSQVTRLRAGAQRLLAGAQRHGLTVLMLDDLHYADSASIELLQGLTGGPACAWLLALRPGAGEPALQAWVGGLQQAATTFQLALGPLDAAGMMRLLESVGATPWASPEQAHRLIRHTGGNPLFVLETLKSLPAGQPASMALPAAPTVVRLVQLRLARLSPPAVQVARCMAVLGQDGTASLVARVLGQRPLQLADAWAELEAAQVVSGDRFAHDLIAQAARDTLPQAIARLLHAEVAALLAHDGGEPVRVAEHWLAAGMPLPAAPLLLQAGRRAAALGRLQEAARLYERSADIQQRHGHRHDAFNAWLRAADGYTEIEDFGATKRCEQSLLALADNDGEMASAACVTFYLLFHARNFDQARRVAEAALAQARRADLAEIEVELLWDLCVVAWNEQAERPATDYAERALIRLDAVDPQTARLDPVTRRFRITEALGLFASSWGHMDQGRIRIAQSFDLAQQMGRTHSALSAAATLAPLALEFGDAQATRTWHQHTKSTHARLEDEDDLAAQAWVWQVSLQVLAPLGDLGAALAASEQMQSLCQRHATSESVWMELMCLQFQHELGRPDLALKGARALSTRDDLRPAERARLTALLLSLGGPAASDALLDVCGEGARLRQRAHLLCQAQPGLPAATVLPLLSLAASEAQAQGAQGLWLMLQASRLSALHRLGPSAADPPQRAQTQALELWARLDQGLIAPVMFPTLAAALCATLAPSHPDLTQTIALRAGAWMLNAAATLPAAWRQTYLTRAPLLQALPPRERGLLFGLAR